MIFDRLRALKPYKTETTPCRIKLSSNESPFGLSEQLRNRIADELKDLPYQRYPDPTSLELKKILSDWYGIAPDQIVLGNGSDELIHLLITVSDLIDQAVMYPVPTFPMYRVSANVLGRKILEIPLSETFELSKESIQQAILQKPGIAFFARPNNPTGNSFDPELIQYVAKQGILTIVDEAYIDFSNQNNLLDMALNTQNIIILRTLSKIGLAGIRLGILIACQSVAQDIDKARGPFNITYPTQKIAQLVLTEGKDEIQSNIQIIRHERDTLLADLQRLQNVTVYPSDSNFILIKVPDGNAIHSQLIKEGILVRNMSGYADLNNFLRLTVGKPEDNQLLMHCLKNCLENA